MAKNEDHYTYRVTWSEEDKSHIGLCVELPSLSWLDTTPETALSGIRNLVQDCVADMLTNGETIPEPLASRQYSGKLMLRIAPETHRSLAIQAAEAGISLNRLIASRLH